MLDGVSEVGVIPPGDGVVEMMPPPDVVPPEPPSADTTDESVLDTLRSPSTWKPARMVCCSFTRQLASVCSPVDTNDRAAVCETPLNNRSPIGSGV